MNLKLHPLSSSLRGSPYSTPLTSLSGPQVRVWYCPDSPLTLQPTPRWLDCEGLPLICCLLPVCGPWVPGTVLRSGRRQRLGCTAESLQQIFAVPKCVPEGPLLINVLSCGRCWCFWKSRGAERGFRHRPLPSPPTLNVEILTPGIALGGPAAAGMELSQVQPPVKEPPESPSRVVSGAEMMKTCSPNPQGTWGSAGETGRYTAMSNAKSTQG